MATRNTTVNLTFGQPTKFMESMTPTRADVFRHYMFLRQQEKTQGVPMETLLECCRKIGDDLSRIWNKFSFPTISHEGICLKVKRLIEDAQKLNKVPADRRVTEKFSQERESYDIMFDICSCTCYDNGIDRSYCKCEVKIPTLEWDAFLGQKKRTNQLGSVDKVVTAKKRRTCERKDRLSERAAQEQTQSLVEDNTKG